MTPATATDPAGQIIATLRAQEAELRRAGIRHLSLFGSVARGEAGADSDVDRLAEPIENPRLRARVERDRVIAF
jgi:predicted nucleotidyltransferase